MLSVSWVNSPCVSCVDVNAYSRSCVKSYSPPQRGLSTVASAIGVCCLSFNPEREIRLMRCCELVFAALRSSMVTVSGFFLMSVGVVYLRDTLNLSPAWVNSCVVVSSFCFCSGRVVLHSFVFASHACSRKLASWTGPLHSGLQSLAQLQGFSPVSHF